MPDYATLMWDEVDDIADLIDKIEDDEFDRDSLCAGWKVRDVIGHMSYGHTTPVVPLLKGVAKYKGNLNKGSFEASKEFAADKSPDELRRFWRGELAEKHTERGIARVIKKHEGFLDHLIHNQDIRRPLGRPRQIPEERLLAALDLLPKVKTPLFATKGTVAGLRWQATDVPWSHGEGSLVEGPGEALILAAAGRAATLDELSGPGVEVLRSRLAG